MEPVTTEQIIAASLQSLKAVRPEPVIPPGQGWMTQAQWAKQMGKNTKTVRRLLEILVERGEWEEAPGTIVRPAGLTYPISYFRMKPRGTP